MKKQLVSIVLIILLTAICIKAQEKIELENVYSFSARIFKNDNVVLLSAVTADVGTVSDFPLSETGYKIKIISHDNKNLFNANLGVSFFLTQNAPELNSTVVSPRVPVYPTAKYIAIYHGNKNIFEIDLSRQLCNNNSICNLGENQYNCPEDCKVAVKEFPWAYAAIVAACVAVLLIIFFYKKSGKESDWQKIYKKWQ